MIRTPLVASLLATSLLAGCGSKGASDAHAQASPSPGTVRRSGVAVRFDPVVRRTLSGTVVASGEVISGPDAEANLAFPTAGQIAMVAVAVGDHVSQGEVLARLDDRIAQRDIAQATADINAAQAQLAKAKAGARPQELAQNRALVGGATAKAQTAQAELSRQQSLAAVGIASRRDVEQARAAYADALADLRDKQQAGSILIAGPRPQDVAVAQAQLEQALTAQATARTRASLLTLTAPFSGVVTARFKNPGEVVDSTTNILTVVNSAASLVDVRLSEDQAALVSPGDPARIAINGAAATIAGRVDTVNAALDPTTRTLEARIAPVTASELRPGATASATITVRTVQDAYVVPAAALVKDPDTGKPLVFTSLGGGTYRRIPVRVVLQSGSYAAVQSSRLPGVARVVTSGAYELLPFAVGGDSS